MSIKDAQNPLFGHENTLGRGFKRYFYTVQDIARVTGRKVGTVRNDVSRGLVVLGDIKSVSRYIERSGKDEEP